MIVVSVVVAAFNVAPYVEEALRSIREQTLRQIEILIVDDGSTDETLSILADHAREDERIIILKGTGSGPGAARNIAISEARGYWIAIVDADDIILPDRLERLVAVATRQQVDAAADNMLAFYPDNPDLDHAWISSTAWPDERSLTFTDLMFGGRGTPRRPELGYLKPLLRRDKLSTLGIAYQEALMIGEDFDLMARWTAAGLTYRYTPDISYKYRRRPSSLSYRMSAGQLAQMIDALDRLDKAAIGYHAESVADRRSAMEAELQYIRMVERLKSGKILSLLTILSNKDSRSKLNRSIHEGFYRRIKKLT